MAHMVERRFTDTNGTAWRVYLVMAAPKVAPMQVPLSAQFRPVKASLAFDSERERRRLAPVPGGWEEAPPSELERLLRLAITVTIRIGDARQR
jgi:hypothetical protein